jgi:hypothetical protein
MKLYYCYALKDPRDGLFYYIGVSDNPKRRLASHMQIRPFNKEKNNWIESLSADELKPEMILLTGGLSLQEAQLREQEYIVLYSSMPLLNKMGLTRGYNLKRNFSGNE